MKNLLILITTFGFIFSGCRKIVFDEVTTTPIVDNTILEGKISANRTLKTGVTYKLRGFVYVTNGATLTIEPGTKIVGELNKNGALIICRGAKIMADGTATSPIIFTSEAAIPQRGDWAGVIILGKAPTNNSFNGIDGVGEIEGGINNAEGLGLYGDGLASNPADNSGILRYVRIEYAGYAVLPDKEINGLTMGCVGNGTIIDYVQVSFANDDSFEWFGGTVNCNHLISYRTLDDDFDTDNGFAGKVQFGIALRDSAVADISNSEAFESDNDANGSSFTPSTSAVFSNMTVLGPKSTLANIGNSKFLAGAQIRRNSTMSLYNSIIAGWPKGLIIDASKGVPTDNNINGATPSLFVQGNIIAGSPQPVVYAASSTAATGADNASILAWYSTAAYSNTILANNTDVKLVAPFNYSSPDFNIADAGSPAASGALFTASKLTGFTQVAYKGACAIGDTWWRTWTKF